MSKAFDGFSFILYDGTYDWFINHNQGFIVAYPFDDVINNSKDPQNPIFKWYLGNPPTNDEKELAIFCRILDYTTSLGLTRKIPIYASINKE